jgi:hypothetical protein
VAYGEFGRLVEGVRRGRVGVAEQADPREHRPNLGDDRAGIAASQ